MLIATKGIIGGVLTQLVVIWSRTLGTRGLFVQGRRSGLGRDRGTEMFHL